MYYDDSSGMSCTYSFIHGNWIDSRESPCQYSGICFNHTLQKWRYNLPCLSVSWPEELFSAILAKLAKPWNMTWKSKFTIFCRTTPNNFSQWSVENVNPFRIFRVESWKNKRYSPKFFRSYFLLLPNLPLSGGCVAHGSLYTA